MAIFRWGSSFDPFAPLRRLQHEMERAAWPWGEPSRRVGGGAYPPVNLYEADGEVVVQCEVPGVEPGELDVNITGETLTIKGVKKPPPDADALRFIRRERGSGEFTRTVVLSDQVDAEKISADLRDGVLTVRLPKMAGPRPRRIAIGSRKD